MLEERHFMSGLSEIQRVQIKDNFFKTSKKLDGLNYTWKKVQLSGVSNNRYKFIMRRNT